MRSSISTSAFGSCKRFALAGKIKASAAMHKADKSETNMVIA
eukprot:CAMPEP_0176126258 /NCGR_PEP_ID=MMETSP0120_2-20121206/63719_1 /TAXON_ID=160619 /ORGANISM="Kryptoperidinium foliaceum, Strain CCMP 1326" /LENGTH=41 /DNA_ID= /DNA_START= /DNA_END= /DNA_ORIENTATION=